MDADGNLAWRRVEFPVLGTLVCPVFNSGKTVFGRAPENAPVVFGRVYTLAVVLISWVFFALEKPGEILAYLQTMFGLNGVGLVNSKALF